MAKRDGWDKEEEILLLDTDRPDGLHTQIHCTDRQAHTVETQADTLQTDRQKMKERVMNKVKKTTHSQI